MVKQHVKVVSNNITDAFGKEISCKISIRGTVGLNFFLGTMSVLSHPSIVLRENLNIDCVLGK